MSSCKSGEDKIRKVLDSISVTKRLNSWMSQVSCFYPYQAVTIILHQVGETKYVKNGSIADKVREQGNVKFGAGDNNAALKLYTESVICAPQGMLLETSTLTIFLPRSCAGSSPG